MESDPGELVRRAAGMIPAGVTNEAGATVAEVYELLRHGEPGAALELLADFYAGWEPPPPFWPLVTDAAKRMEMRWAAAWAQWQLFENRHGVIRVSLTLLPASAGGRDHPIPPEGVLRPLWDIGQVLPGGRPDLRLAHIWTEFAPLHPGGTGTARLAPIAPEEWTAIQPGQQLTMHEGNPVAGTAVVLETRPPVSGHVA